MKSKICGHNYEQEAIMQHISRGRGRAKCPVCGQLLTKADLEHNAVLQYKQLSLRLIPCRFNSLNMLCFPRMLQYLRFSRVVTKKLTITKPTVSMVVIHSFTTPRTQSLTIGIEGRKPCIAKLCSTARHFHTPYSQMADTREKTGA